MRSNSLIQSVPYRKGTGLSFSSGILSAAMAAMDAVGVFAVGIGWYISYLGWQSTTYPTYVGASLLGSLLLIAALNHNGYYAPHFGNRFLTQFRGIASSWLGVFLSLVLAAYALKISANVSRVWSFAWFSSALLLLLVQRMLLSQFIIKAADQGKLAQRTIILGAGEHGKRLLRHLERFAEPWITVTGLFDDRLARVGQNVMGYPVRGNLADLLQHISEQRVDSILIALPRKAERRVAQLTETLRDFSMNIYLAPDGIGFIDHQQEFEFIARIPMLRIASRPIRGWRRFVKEAEDRLVTLPLLLFLMPLMLIIAAAIKLDSKGPVFYRQVRRGFNKKTFKILKFRTMHNDCGVQNRFQQARRNDVRVTRVGRILRCTSLDEVPQLINVLKGDMSLIGPRPHPIPLDEQYAPRITHYFARNRIKPGITGWAQVNGFRGETQTLEMMEKRVTHDIYYMENWSLIFDIQILVMTAFVGFVHKNAY